MLYDIKIIEIVVSAKMGQRASGGLKGHVDELLP